MSLEHIPFLKDIEKIRSYSFFGTKPESVMIGIVLLDTVRILRDSQADVSTSELIKKQFSDSNIVLNVEELDQLTLLCDKLSEISELKTETLDKTYQVLSNSLIKNYKRTRNIFLFTLFVVSIFFSLTYFFGDRILHPRVFKATYFANSTLSGTPFGEYYEPMPSKDWGAGAPRPGLPVNFFSARFETIIKLNKDTELTFSTISDDGVRLFVDGEKILDYWLPQDSVKRFITKNYKAGEHSVKLEYFEAEVGAKLFFDVRDPDGNVPKLVTP